MKKKVLFPVVALVLALSLALPMAATVGADDDEPLVYGMQRNTATIYGINPTDGTISTLMDTELWASQVGPNGLAYDEDNDIVYWVTYYDANPWQVKLCYWNKEATEYPWHLKVQDGLAPPNYYLPDGTPNKGVTCADFYDGKYYYIPNNTDDLYAVTISRTSDTEAEVTQIDVFPNISGDDDYAWNFGGDIAIGPDGVIYGVGDATPAAAGGPYHFFSVNRDGTGFDLIDPDVHEFSFQLAFALDGTLYGHDSRDDGLFYAVDTTNGDLSAAYPNDTNYLYTDLASGPRGQQDVHVDIKPTSCPNPLNVNSKGVLPVAILGTDEFDVTQVDPASVRLEGVAPLRWAIEDVATPFDGEVADCEDCTTDGLDGYDDLTLKFDTQAIVAALGEASDGDCVEVVLTGNLKPEFGGTAIAGVDYVVIRKKGRP